MAGPKDSANLFEFLDRNDPGDSDAAKTTAAPAATSLTQELFGHAYLSARDYLIRQNQLERQAMAEKRAADRAKSAAARTYSNVQDPGSKQQSGMSGGRRSYNNNGAASRRQQPSMAAKKKVPAEDVEATLQVPAPSPPSLYDINEFPSLK